VSLKYHPIRDIMIWDYVAIQIQIKEAKKTSWRTKEKWRISKKKEKIKTPPYMN